MKKREYCNDRSAVSVRTHAHAQPRKRRTPHLHLHLTYNKTLPSRPPRSPAGERAPLKIVLQNRAHNNPALECDAKNQSTEKAKMLVQICRCGRSRQEGWYTCQIEKKRGTIAFFHVFSFLPPFFRARRHSSSPVDSVHQSANRSTTLTGQHHAGALGPPLPRPTCKSQLHSFSLIPCPPVERARWEKRPALPSPERSRTQPSHDPRQHQPPSIRTATGHL